MIATKKLKVEVYKNLLVWRVKLIGSNGETVMHSETYFSKGNAERAAKLIKGAKIV